MARKKDYVAIANMIAEKTLNYWGKDAMRLRDSLAKRMAYYFADDNPKFDRGQFLEACGVK